MIRRIASLIKANIAEQGYVGVLAGIVIPYQKKLADDPVRYVTYALSCDVAGKECSDEELVALFPDDSKKSVIFFEDRTGARPVGFEDQWLKMQCTLRVVGWVNPPQMGIDPACSGCSTGFQVAMNILKLLPGRNTNIPDCKISTLNVQFAAMAPEGENIFARYTAIAQAKPWNVAPYEYFALDLLCTWRVHPSCFEGPEVGDPICPSSPEGTPDPPQAAACPIVRVCREGDIEPGEAIVWDGEKWVHDTIEAGGDEIAGGTFSWDPDPVTGGLRYTRDGNLYEVQLNPLT